jgi:uncharacterized repeat protein (TIGR01451 family)
MNAADFWQLPINGQTPQTFAQNFFHNVRHELRHTDLDRLTFTASGRAIDAAPLMSFGDALAVTRNGKPFFAGTALPPRLVGQNNEENHLYTVVSPWYDLTRTFYQQQRTVWDGTYVNEGGILLPHTVTEYLSTLVLFMQQNGSLLTAQQQIQDAINFAVNHGMSAEGLNVRVGRGDLNAPRRSHAVGKARRAFRMPSARQRRANVPPVCPDKLLTSIEIVAGERMLPHRGEMRRDVRMKRIRWCLFLVVCAVCGVQAQGTRRQELPGHVPAAVAHLQPVGRLPGQARLRLAIGLPLRNREALTGLLQQIYDPSTSHYHHYLTPQQFTEMFGPTEDDYLALTAFAKANGLTVVRAHPNRGILDVEGAVSDIEKALQVTMRIYQHPVENRTFYAPDMEPSVDTTVPILHISGLDNYTLPHPRMHKVPVDHVKNTIPRSGSGPGGSYMGRDFRAAYAPGVALTGSGQKLGLFEFDGYYANDIAAYEASNGLSSVTLSKVLLDGFNGIPTTGPNSGNTEVALDIELAISMAPGLSEVIVYEAGGDNGNPDDILDEMANPTQGEGLPKQLSCSWGWNGPDPTADQYFQQMAAQGQAFFDASGDNDAFPAGQSTSGDFPSDDPYITQVGGTTLTTTGPQGSWVSETVWNSGVVRGEGPLPLGSGGGISTEYSIPSWQQGVNMSANQGSTTMRNVPDVAMVANNVSIIADNDPNDIIQVVGTSCSTPLWAGFIALANEQAAANGESPVGFINPAIYKIGQGPNYPADFHDITTGNNEWSRSRDQFVAVAGYDLCTGWGSPNGTSLINALASGVADLTVGQTVSPDPTITGEELTYTISVVNNGPSKATKVTVTDMLPATVTFDSAALSQGTSTFASGIVNCALGSLTANSTATVNITVVPTAAGAITNTVTVGAGNAGNNSNTVVTTVLTPPRLGVSPPSYDFATVPTGTTALAEFVVTNQGGAMLTGTATVSGDPFAVVWDNSFSVAAAGSAPVVVGFTPSSALDFTGVVVFASNGGSSTNLLIGTGTTNMPSVTAPPTLMVLSPADYQTFTNAAAAITGLVSDPSGINSVTVNGIAATMTGIEWSATLTLSTGTNALTIIATDDSANMNTTTQIVHAVFWRSPADAAPVILSTPVVTNAVLQAGDVAVVVAGETNTFAVNAIDPAGGLLNYQWLFGDGTMSSWLATNTATHVYTNECGPLSASVTVSNGQATASSNLDVAVACPLIISKVQLKANFRKADADSCNLSVAFDLSAIFNLANQVVAVDVGGAQAQFNLDDKGKGHGVGPNGTCKLSFDKHTALWTATVDMKDGSWQNAWAAYGMTNSTILKPGAPVTNVPVVLAVGSQAFMGTTDLRYTSKDGQSGTAK